MDDFRDIGAANAAIHMAQDAIARLRVEVARLTREQALPVPCNGAGTIARDLQGLTEASSLPCEGVCGVCEQRVRVDGFQRCTVHPFQRDALRAQLADAREALLRGDRSTQEDMAWIIQQRDTLRAQLEEARADFHDMLASGSATLKLNDDLRALATQLAGALRAFVKMDIEDPYAPVTEAEAIAARAALAAAEKFKLGND